jgi:hypothetical protein
VKSERWIMSNSELASSRNEGRGDNGECANPSGNIQVANDQADSGRSKRLRSSAAGCLIQSLGCIEMGRMAREIYEARNRVGESIRSFLEHARQLKSAEDRRRVPAKRKLVKAAAGIGKTQEFAKVAQQYASEHGLRILYLAPTHDLLGEVAKKLPDAKLVGGREQKGQCQRTEVVRKVTELNQSVEQTICKHCPLRDSCQYQETLRSISAEQHGVVVLATHQQLAFMWKDFEFDAVVIDEAFISVMYDAIEFHPDRLEAAKARDSRLESDLDRILAAFREDPVNLLAALQRGGFTAADHFADLVAGLEALVNADKIGIDPVQPDDVLLGELSKAVAHETWKILALVNQLQREIGFSRPSANGVEYRPAARVKVDGKPETQERIGVFRLRPLAVGHGVPILMLDATADITLLKRVLGNRISSEIIPVRRNAVIIQATSAQFDRRSMLKEESKDTPGYRRKLSRFVAELGARRPLLITHKEVKEQMRQEKLIRSSWRVAHFGAIRGIDDWKKCDIVIVAGRLQPAPRAVLCDARCLFSDDPTALPIDSELTPAEACLAGCGTTVRTLRYTDPRLQAVLEQSREQEISQAVDRLRLINCDGTKLVIILSTVATDIPVDLALTWPELRRRLVPIAETASKHEVIRLNPKEVERDLAKKSAWKSGRHFLNDVAELAEAIKGDEQDAYRIMFPFHQVVKYRLTINGKRQSGKAKKALVRQDAGAVDQAIALRYANDNRAITVEIAGETPETKQAS